MKKLIVLLITLMILSCSPNHLEKPPLSSELSHIVIFEDGVILKTFPDSFEGTTSFQILNYRKNINKGPFYGGREITLNLGDGFLSRKVVIEVPWVSTNVLTLLEHDGKLYQVGRKCFSKNGISITIDAKDLSEIIDNELKIYIFKTIGVKGREMEISGVGKKNSLKIFYEEQGLNLEECELVLDSTSQATLTRDETTVEVTIFPLEPTMVNAKLLVNIEGEQIIVDENEMVVRDEVNGTFEEFLPVIHLECGLKILDLVDVLENSVFYHSNGCVSNPKVEDLVMYGSSKSLIVVESLPESSPVVYQEVFRDNEKIFMNFWLFLEKDGKFYPSFFSIVLEEASGHPSYVILSQGEEKFKISWNDVMKISEHPIIYVTRSGSFHHPTAKGTFLKPSNFLLNVPWYAYRVERISSHQGLGLFCGMLMGERLPPFRKESIEIERILDEADTLGCSSKLVFEVETQYGYLEGNLIVPRAERTCIRLSPRNFILQDSKILWFSEGKLLGEGPEIFMEFHDETEIEILVETEEGLIGFESYEVIPLERPSKPILKVADVSKDKIHLSWDCEGKITCFELQRKDFQDFHCISVTKMNDYIDENISQGENYSYRIRALNHTLPSSWSDTVEVTVPDNTPPEPPHDPIPPDGAEDIETNVTLRWCSKDHDGDNMIFTIFLTSSGTTKKFQTHENQLHLRGLDPHTKYFWRVKAYDGEVESWSSTWTFTTINHPPKLFLKDQSVKEGERLLMDLTESTEDEDNDPLTFDLLTGPGTLINDLYIFIPNYQDAGVHKVTLKVSDGFDEVTGSFKVIVEDVNRPPEVPENPYPEDGAKDVLSNITLKWDAEDPDGDELTFDVVIESDLGGFKKSVTTTSKMVPIDLKGHTSYTWKVVARDSEFCVEGPLWSFKTKNNPPELSIDDVEIFEGETLVLDLRDHARDLDGDNLSFSLVKGPGVLENDRYSFATDFDDAGVYEIILKVSDGFDDTTCTFHVIVLDKNRPPNVPQLLSPENGSTDVNVSKVTLSWKCSDPDGDELRYHVYFGENELLYAGETSSTSITIEDLKYGTTYLWKVVALDEHGEAAESEIFSFSTRNWWTRVFDVEGEEKFVEIRRIDDKLYLLGSRTINGEDTSSIAVLDSEGNLLNIIDLGNFGPIYGLCKTDKGFVAITYGALDTHILWLTENFEISNIEVLEGITVGRTLLELGNGYISVGSTINDKDGVVIFLDENGDVEVHKFDISKNMDEFSCAVLDDDGFIVVGTIFNDDYDILLVKLNEDLETVWMKEFKEISNDFGKSLIKVDNGYLISGKRFDSGRSCIYVLKVDDEREKIWEETIGFDSSCFVESMVENETGVIVVGWRRNPYDGVIVELTKEGEVALKDEVGGNGSDFLYDVVPLNRGFLILGSSDSWGKDKNIYLIKIDEYGNFSEEPEVITWQAEN